LPKIGIAWEKKKCLKKKKSHEVLRVQICCNFGKKYAAREAKGYSLPDSADSYVYPDCLFSTCNLKFPPKSWSPVCAAAYSASMITLLPLVK